MMWMLFFLMTLFSFSFPSVQYEENSAQLNLLLTSYVDSIGNVNYNGIIKNPFALNDYLQFVEHVSPDSKPDYFKSDNAKKAFWINTYNAVILKLMVDNPGKDILDVGVLGYDVFLKKFKIGNKNISPFYIENKILRKMNDPRIHFAINCGSKSCPPLGNKILLESELDKQLEEKASRFINNTSNVYVDYQSEKIYVNRIFKWFKKDFGNLTKYLCQYLKNDSYDDIKDFKVIFLDYDWTINSK